MRPDRIFVDYSASCAPLGSGRQRRHMLFIHRVVSACSSLSSSPPPGAITYDSIIFPRSKGIAGPVHALNELVPALQQWDVRRSKAVLLPLLLNLGVEVLGFGGQDEVSGL